jgi:hypothetical protein
MPFVLKYLTSISPRRSAKKTGQFTSSISVDQSGCITPLAPWVNGDTEVQRAVLSYSAGADVFSNYLFELGVEAFKGEYLPIKPSRV